MVSFGFKLRAAVAPWFTISEVLDDGRAAVWNAWHPFRALAVGDRIVEINGVHVGRQGAGVGGWVWGWGKLFLWTSGVGFLGFGAASNCL